MNSTENRPVTWKRIGLVLVILVVWGGANLAVILIHDEYELHQLANEHEIAPHVLRQFESRSVELPTSSDAGGIPLFYRFRPPSHGNGDRKTPLVVCLHGAGDRGTDNVQQLGGFVSALCQDEVIEAFPCAILAPQCPVRLSWSSPVDASTDVLTAVLLMIDDVLQDHRIDPDRVYLIGYSMGGFGAWELAARNPERFAAVIPIAGGGDPKLGRDLVNVPIWAVHGLDDDAVPIDGSRRMVEAIRDAGGAPRLWELTGVGHRAWTEVLKPESDVLPWLFQQRLSGSQVEQGALDTSAT